jgi:hypothetical protein
MEHVSQQIIRHLQSAWLLVAIALLLHSCQTLQKSSQHGLNSGYYRLIEKDQPDQRIYLDTPDDQLIMYKTDQGAVQQNASRNIVLGRADSLLQQPIRLKKQSLDIDLTSILLKYRPSSFGEAPQLVTDFNFAVYTGWRFDTFKVISEKDPLGNGHNRIANHGFDFGVFAGPGTTLISPFTTRDRRAAEYNGLIIQSGLAMFVETDLASFGIAGGFDYLLNEDRNVWIYHNKPWAGFIVGIALN